MLKDPILWLDLETDGTTAENGLTLEIGCVLTEGLDTYVDEFSAVINPKLHGIASLVWHRMPSVVKTMHTDTGLWEECLVSEHTEGTAMAACLDWLFEHGVIKQDGEPKAVTWGGKGVSHFDGPWLERRMPQLWQWLRYWSYDVSPIRRVGSLAGIEEPNFFEGATQHRALDDARAAWQAAQWWRNQLYACKDPGQFPRMEKKVRSGE